MPTKGKTLLRLIKLSFNKKAVMLVLLHTYITAFNYLLASNFPWLKVFSLIFILNSLS